MLGVCEDTMTGWENDRSFPQIMQYPKLIKFLGYNPFKIDNTSLSGRIKQFRAEEGISQRKLAELLEVDQSTLRSWELGAHTPLPSKMKVLDRILKSKEPIK